MRAVWSFWSKPYNSFHSNCWASEAHHLFSWILSVETARHHYPNTALYTDDQGAALLVDVLGLNFRQVSTELNALADIDAQWWALGKLYTYRVQSEPFIHIDSDVFLWDPLPKSVATAPVFAQNVEQFEIGNSYYRPQLWDTIIETVDGWLPVEWQWYSKCQGTEAICCGILGGLHTDFITHYAECAINLVTHPRNQKAWPFVADRIGDNILVEQYLLSACLHYHHDRKDSRFLGIEAKFVFDSEQAAFDPRQAKLAGYTHLIAGAKRNPEIAKRLEARVRRDYPRQYEKAIRIAQAKC